MPLGGATVYYNTDGGLAGGASGNGTAVTDDAGRFTTTGKGGSLLIQAIVKDGYQVPARAQGYGFDNGGQDYEPWTKFTKEHPKLFRAWKVPSDMIVPESLVKGD